MLTAAPFDIMLHEILLLYRWKDKDVYDILVECAELSLDTSENAGITSAADHTTASQSSPQLSNGYCQPVVVNIHCVPKNVYLL